MQNPVSVLFHFVLLSAAALLMTAAAAAQSGLPEPVRAELAMTEQMCGATFDDGADGAIHPADMDGDGVDDFLIAAEPICPGNRLICGAANCPYTLFVFAGGSWARFDYVLPVPPEFGPDGLRLDCPDGVTNAGVFAEDGKLVKRDCR